MENLINEFLNMGDQTVLNNLETYIYENNRYDEKYWEYMINNTRLNDEKIIENLDYINLSLLIEKQILSNKILENEQFFEKIKLNNLISKIIKSQKICVNIIDKFISEGIELDWYDICRYQKLSIEAMNKYKEFMIWDIISENQFMTFEFICENKESINWTYLSKNIKIEFLLNEAFIELFKENDIWGILIWSNNLSEEYILKNLDKLTSDQIYELCEIRSISESGIYEILKKNNYDKDLLSIISENQDLSIEFIKKNIDNLNLDEIIKNQNLTFEFINDFKDKISLNSLSYNDYLNQDLILKIYKIKNEFDEDFDWEYISEYVDFDDKNAKLIPELDKSILIQKKILN